MGTWAHKQGHIDERLYYIATFVLFTSLVIMATEKTFEGLTGGRRDE